MHRRGFHVCCTARKPKSGRNRRSETIAPKPSHRFTNIFLSTLRCVIRERVGQPTGIHRQESGHASLRHAESSRKRRMFRRVCARTRAIRAGGGRRHDLCGEVRCGVRPDNRSIRFVTCLVRPIGVPPPVEPMRRGRGQGRAASAAQRPSGSAC